MLKSGTGENLGSPHTQPAWLDEGGGREAPREGRANGGEASIWLAATSPAAVRRCRAARQLLATADSVVQAVWRPIACDRSIGSLPIYQLRKNWP